MLPVRMVLFVCICSPRADWGPLHDLAHKPPHLLVEVALPLAPLERVVELVIVAGRPFKRTDLCVFTTKRCTTPGPFAVGMQVPLNLGALQILTCRCCSHSSTTHTLRPWQ